jgi:hypothetical protein
MNKPCEYCGRDLPLGVDKKTRQQRSHHFATCKARPVPEVEPFAQRTWVGLTDEEIQDALEIEFLGCDAKRNWQDDLRVAQAIEAKLKEKNT